MFSLLRRFDIKVFDPYKFGILLVLHRRLLDVTAALRLPFCRLSVFAAAVISEVAWSTMLTTAAGSKKMQKSNGGGLDPTGLYRHGLDPTEVYWFTSYFEIKRKSISTRHDAPCGVRASRYFAPKSAWPRRNLQLSPKKKTSSPNRRKSFRVQRWHLNQLEPKRVFRIYKKKWRTLILIGEVQWKYSAVLDNL